MKIVFWGNSNFSLKPLQILAQHYPIAAVVTAPDTFVGRGQSTPRQNPVKEFALAKGLPLLQPASVKKNPDLEQTLGQIGAELYVLVSYGKIIPASIFNLPPKRMINLHASLLPQLRGASPIQFALWQGLGETGNTVQYIAAGMDTGDVLAQSLVRISDSDDYFSLEEKLAQDGAELLLKTVQAMEKGRAPSLPQNNDAATYCSLITKADGIVEFMMTAEEIVCAFKALKSFPSIALPLECGMVKILDCAQGEGKGKAGEILDISPEGLLVACHEGALLIKQLQAPAKKAAHARDFANGLRLKKGDILK